MQDKVLIKKFEIEKNGRVFIYDSGNNKISLEHENGNVHCKIELPRGAMCVMDDCCIVENFEFVFHKEEDKKIKKIHFYEANVSFKVFETDESHIDRLMQIIKKLKG